VPLKIKDYSYPLPKNLIANQPSIKRDHCHLLTLNKNTGEINHLHFYDIVDLLGPNDVLVLNQSKVFPARLFGKKDSGGEIELLLIRQLKADTWLSISKPRPKVGQKLIFSRNLFGKVIKSDPKTGQIEINFNFKNEKFFQVLDKIGHTPIPPYIHSSQTEPEIRSEYQTIYAKEIGSAAAPTAGLHFTKNLLLKLKKKGVQIEYITLHVGLGTFQNLRPEDIKSKTLHSEFYEIKPSTAKRLNQAKKSDKRIIAVGTTSVRTLESSSIKMSFSPSSRGDVAKPQRGFYQIIAEKKSTNIFIYPPYKFKFVDCLITNFHLPESSLLMLVSALASKERIFKAYQQAINQKYRFFSFGDAMFIY
jgi:S-adenosylmethionine:tRNA ribosyltransferase-isomerase